MQTPAGELDTTNGSIGVWGKMKGETRAHVYSNGGDQATSPSSQPRTTSSTFSCALGMNVDGSTLKCVGVSIASKSEISSDRPRPAPRIRSRSFAGWDLATESRLREREAASPQNTESLPQKMRYFVVGRAGAEEDEGLPRRERAAVLKGRESSMGRPGLRRGCSTPSVGMLERRVAAISRGCADMRFARDFCWSSEPVNALSSSKEADIEDEESSSIPESESCWEGGREILERRNDGLVAFGEAAQLSAGRTDET